MNQHEQFAEEVSNIAYDAAVDAETSSIAFYANSTGGGVLGFSTSARGPSKADDMELLAYHLFELSTKYHTPAKELLSETISIFNESREEWRENLGETRMGMD